MFVRAETQGLRADQTLKRNDGNQNIGTRRVHFTSPDYRALSENEDKMLLAWNYPETI
jgi:hypothetical protein